jgi:hypothetical protein
MRVGGVEIDGRVSSVSLGVATLLIVWCVSVSVSASASVSVFNDGVCGQAHVMGEMMRSRYEVDHLLAKLAGNTHTHRHTHTHTHTHTLHTHTHTHTHSRQVRVGVD